MPEPKIKRNPHGCGIGCLYAIVCFFACFAALIITNTLLVVPQLDPNVDAFEAGEAQGQAIWNAFFPIVSVVSAVAGLIGYLRNRKV